MADLHKPDANDLAEQRTSLAAERTIMAAERTLMAWVRTAISMIGFGFTVYKFLEAMQRDDPSAIRLEGPRNLALTFIGLGVLSLVIAVLQHRQFMKRSGNRDKPRPFDLTLAVAGIVALIGVFTFSSVLFRIGPF